MGYVVVKRFKDLQDGEHLYQAGDTFPREELDVSEERLIELSTTANRRGVVLIEKVEQDDSDDGVVSRTEKLVRPGDAEVEADVSDNRGRSRRKRNKPAE